mmetsp:Transcript_31068/g.79331  ORF Transcript_31068/g.79331 Transcript_31068/m.79331 type:complete len:256 (-) Transcript_31068:350-1117(-)
MAFCDGFCIAGLLGSRQNGTSRWSMAVTHALSELVVSALAILRRRHDLRAGRGVRQSAGDLEISDRQPAGRPLLRLDRASLVPGRRVPDVGEKLDLALFVGGHRVVDVWRVPIAVLGAGEDLAEADIGAVPGAAVRVGCDVLAPCDLARTVVDGAVLHEELARRGVLHHSDVLCEVVDVVLSRPVPVLIPLLARKVKPVGGWLPRPTPPAIRGADVCPGVRARRAACVLALVLFWADLEVVILAADALVVRHVVD